MRTGQLFDNGMQFSPLGCAAEQVDDTGQIPLGMARAGSSEDVTLGMRSDRYLAFIEEAVARFQRLAEGRAALLRGDVRGAAAKLKLLAAEIIGGFQQRSAEVARFRANLPNSTAPKRLNSVRSSPADRGWR